MPSRPKEELLQIREVLKKNPEGLSITDISDTLDINRNFVAKYLRIFLEAGELKLERKGPAKIYKLTQGVPITNLLDMMYDRVIVINSREIVTQVNKSFQELLPENEKDIVGHSIKKLPLPKHLIFEIRRWLRHDDEQKQLNEFEFCDGTGSGITYQARFVRATLRNGSTGVAVILNDITSSANMERDYRLFKRIVDENWSSVIITEAELEKPGPRIVFMNQAASEMTGYQPIELIGKSPRILQGQKTDREMMRRLKRALRMGRSFSGRTINYKKNGEEYIVQWDIHPVRDRDGHITHFVSMQKDATEATAENRLLTRYELQQELLLNLTREALEGREQKELIKKAARIARDITDAAIVVRMLSPIGELEPVAFSHSEEQMKSLYRQLQQHLTLNSESQLFKELEESGGVVYLDRQNRYKLFNSEDYLNDEQLVDIPWYRMEIYALKKGDDVIGTIECWHASSRSSTHLVETMNLIANTLSLSIACGDKQ